MRRVGVAEDREARVMGGVAYLCLVVGLAGRLGAGLIVVGSRGRGPLRRALMGSVSDSVIRHAHCPVMVVRNAEGKA